MATWCKGAKRICKCDILCADCKYFDGSGVVQVEIKTNADRIRAMSDEELAEFLERAFFTGCPEPARSCWENCTDCLVDWLKQPVKDGEDA